MSSIQIPCSAKYFLFPMDCTLLQGKGEVLVSRHSQSKDTVLTLNQSVSAECLGGGGKGFSFLVHPYSVGFLFFGFFNNNNNNNKNQKI